MRKTVFLAVLVAILWCAPSYAAFRCGQNGNDLGETGISKYEMLRRCGPPAS